MILPKDKEYANLAINRMPVYTNYFGQNNDTEFRSHQELTGHTHQLMINMIREMFETMITNFILISKEVNSKSQAAISNRTLTEVENIY